MAIPTNPDPPTSRDWLYAEGEEALAANPAPPPLPEPAPPLTAPPPGIEIDTIQFADWSHFTQVKNVYIARVTTADQVVEVCNWAVARGFTVRAAGEFHNWSPLLLQNAQASDHVLLVDMTELNSCSFDMVAGRPQATFGAGITLEGATAYLETLDNQGASMAPGYSFPHMPAPGNLTMGGMLAIGAHGTCVPSGTNPPELMGSLSDLIVEFDAVVTDPAGPNSTTYGVRHFSRSDPDAAAFLVHLGRALLTSVTLRVVPNYFVQLKPIFPPVEELFVAPSGGALPAQAFSTLLDEYGRVEVLWFPFTDKAFVQCARVQNGLGGAPETGPYNYPWMNKISPSESELIEAAMNWKPWLAPLFGATELGLAQTNLTNSVLNGTARRLELYLQDTTIHVTLSGWALQIPRAEVQAVASTFFEHLAAKMNEARAAGKYPVNAATEFRCTTLDRQNALGVPGAMPPALAATHSVDPSDPSLDTIIWLNVAVVPRSPDAPQFLADLEAWMLQTWGSQQPNRFRPEWSKAWAWTAAGPWTNGAMIAGIRDAYNQPTTAPLTWDWAAATLAKYDASRLFTNPFLDELFPP